MVCDKNWVPPERSLPSIVRRPRRRQSCRHEPAGMLEYRWEPSVAQVRPLALLKAEPAPEGRAGERDEDIVKRSHRYSYSRGGTPRRWSRSSIARGDLLCTRAIASMLSPA